MALPIGFELRLSFSFSFPCNLTDCLLHDRTRNFSVTADFSNCLSPRLQCKDRCQPNQRSDLAFVLRKRNVANWRQIPANLCGSYQSVCVRLVHLPSFQTVFLKRLELSSVELALLYLPQRIADFK